MKYLLCKKILTMIVHLKYEESDMGTPFNTKRHERK